MKGINRLHYATPGLRVVATPSSITVSSGWGTDRLIRIGLVFFAAAVLSELYQSNAGPRVTRA